MGSIPPPPTTNPNFPKTRAELVSRAQQGDKRMFMDSFNYPANFNKRPKFNSNPRQFTQPTPWYKTGNVGMIGNMLIPSGIAYGAYQSYYAKPQHGMSLPHRVAFNAMNKYPKTFHSIMRNVAVPFERRTGLINRYLGNKFSQGGQMTQPSFKRSTVSQVRKNAQMVKLLGRKNPEFFRNQGTNRRNIYRRNTAPNRRKRVNYNMDDE